VGNDNGGDKAKTMIRLLMGGDEGATGGAAEGGGGAGGQQGAGDGRGGVGGQRDIRSMFKPVAVAGGPIK
jgi:hypothetical protein